jgi:hypothetical protein
MSIENLMKLNVNNHVEKKNNLSYLSWAWAWAEALKADPSATYETQFFDGKPFVDINGTAMVFVTVTMFGKPMTCQLPVMDYKNKAIPEPDAFAVNTAIMRCMTKALSLHGLGLYIYAGEDLPQDDQKGPGTVIKALPTVSLPDDRKSLMHDVAEAINQHMHSDDVLGAYEEASGVTDSEEKTYLWSLLDSKTRSAIKRVSAELKE